MAAPINFDSRDPRLYGKPLLDEVKALSDSLDAALGKPTYQDWVRAVRERDVERVKPKKRRSGY